MLALQIIISVLIAQKSIEILAASKKNLHSSSDISKEELAGYIKWLDILANPEPDIIYQETRKQLVPVSNKSKRIWTPEAYRDPDYQPFPRHFETIFDELEYYTTSPKKADKFLKIEFRANDNDDFHEKYLRKKKVEFKKRLESDQLKCASKTGIKLCTLACKDANIDFCKYYQCDDKLIQIPRKGCENECYRAFLLEETKYGPV